jgi:hypothetical protein
METKLVITIRSSDEGMTRQEIRRSVEDLLADSTAENEDMELVSVVELSKEYYAR